MEVDLDVLGYIDANITVNIIRDGVRVAKKHLELPKKLVNIIHCKNPRCITVAEPQLDAIFLLSDPEKAHLPLRLLRHRQGQTLLKGTQKPPPFGAGAFPGKPIMNETTSSHLLRGSLCTMLGGVCWGFSGTCGQYLFSRFGVSTLWLTCLRLLAGGVIMLALAAVRHRRELRNIWRCPGDAAMLVAYGLFGLMMCQYAYMTSISYSNAGTTTVLQTLSLVIIMLLTCLRLRRATAR